MNQEKIIYEEKKASRFTIVTLLLFSILSLYAYVHQAILKLGVIGNRPAPSWLYLIIFIIFAVCLLSFNTIRLKITNSEITVGFNRFFSQKIQLADIEKVEMDDKSYGGSGLRMRLTGGKFRIAYNAGPPRVVISIKNKRREIAFSSNNPEQIIKILKNKKVD